MNRIHLQQTLPQVFAGRDTVTSQIWHQNIVFSKAKNTSQSREDFFAKPERLDLAKS